MDKKPSAKDIFDVNKKFVVQLWKIFSASPDVQLKDDEFLQQRLWKASEYYYGKLAEIIGEPFSQMLLESDNKEIDEVVLIYTSFISTMEQQVKNEVILPFEVEKDPEFMTVNKFVEYEPSVEAVFNYLVPKYVETKIYSAVVESATCEHAARRMAMENATDNAREMLDALNLNYNRARQSAITDEIIEIVAGSEAQN